MLPDEQQSATLIVSLAGGNERALEELVRLWEPCLLSFAYRYVQNEAESRDLVQETFVRLYKNAASYKPGRSPAGWLFTIAANLCRNHQRWRRRHPAVSLEESPESGFAARTLVCSKPTPELMAEKQERVGAVREAIASLPHDLKTALLLFEYENLGYREIAAAVGCSEKGVEARLSRARALLRKRLSGWLEDGKAPGALPGGIAPGFHRA